MTPDERLSQYKLVKKAYEVKLFRALQRTSEEVRHIHGLNQNFYLSNLNTEVLEAIQAWPPRIPTWCMLHKSANNRRPMNFSVAMYNHLHVYGVAFGRVSRGKTHVRIDYLEGHPGNHPWKGIVLPTAIRAAIYYAEEIGAKRVLLTDPENSEKLHEIYREITHSFVPPEKSEFDRGHYVINLE